MTDNSDVKEYYDSFTEYELRSGINLRHYTLFNKIIQTGLQKHHRVLEIGCGVGQLTFLLHRYLRRGRLVSVDISPVSVQLAKKRIGDSSRMEFFVSDMSEFEYPGQFDYIILPDVMEHIPVENHHALLGLLNSLMHKDSKIIIHIPHPKAIEFIRIHEPGKLQIIDQSLSAEKLLRDAYAHDLLLDRYESYSIFSRGYDYVFIVLRQNNFPSFSGFSKSTIILKKSIQRILCLFNTIK